MNHAGRSQAKSKPIRTNLLELLQALTSQTSDDNLVLAAMKELFRSNRIRLANTLAPVRLVEATVPVTRHPRRRLH
ncbi:MAG: hypothetical protein FJ145_02455 [Deltaproteobacteria bacterium]|nr:hypothetical protein [Deltaproteobacteria bacterium]